MGLTVTHGCFNGPYRTFHWWRTAIATAAGIEIEKMEGYCEDEGVIPIRWNTLEPDILHVCSSTAITMAPSPPSSAAHWRIDCSNCWTL